MISVDLKRHGEPSPLATFKVGEHPQGFWAQMLQEAPGTVITVTATDATTGRTIFLRGRVK